MAFSLIANKKQAYNKLFSKIFIVMPPSSLTSLNVKAIRTHKRVYPELSEETLDSIDESTDELNEKGKEYHSLGANFFKTYPVAKRGSRAEYRRWQRILSS